MSESTSAGSGGTESEGPAGRLAWWILFSGNRLLVGVFAMAGAFALTLALVRLDVIAVGPNAPVASVFGSMLAGLLTLVTVTLTINQLILSRVFGTPNTLSDQLDGNRQFRQSIEDLVGRRTLPNHPHSVLSVIGDGLAARAANYRDAVSAPQTGGDPLAGIDGIESQAETLRSIDADETSVVEVVECLIGTQYARNIATADRLHDLDGFSDEAQSALDAMTDLLESVAIMRQYYKTLALQQMLARLSRLVTYFGFLSILTAFYVALVYRTNGNPTVGAQYRPLLVSAGVAVSLSPLLVFLSYVLRFATVSRHTLSVGPFVPPKR